MRVRAISTFDTVLYSVVGVEHRGALQSVTPFHGKELYAESCHRADSI